MSNQADKVFELLKELFPHNRIKKEYYVNYKGHKLFFDFYVRELGIFIEVQGQQHTKFVKHFHGNGENFLAQKNRDNLKLMYIEENDIYSLVQARYDEEITKKLLLSKVKKALVSAKGYVE